MRPFNTVASKRGMFSILLMSMDGVTINFIAQPIMLLRMEGSVIVNNTMVADMNQDLLNNPQPWRKKWKMKNVPEVRAKDN